MMSVLPDNNYQQKSCCHSSKTASINSSAAVSDPKQYLSAAELMSVIPISNYQQQSGTLKQEINSFDTINFYSVKEQKTQRKNHRSSSLGFTSTSKGSLVDLYVLQYACLGRRRLYRSRNMQAIYHRISELC
jgi:hypothetical protein